MQNKAVKIIQSLPTHAHLTAFAHRLLNWLLVDLGQDSPEPTQFGESRAKALLRAADLLDEPTRHSFQRLTENETAVRLALSDLLQSSSLADEEEVAALATTTAASRDDTLATQQTAVSWQTLAITAYAWKNGYPIHQLDPASPPEPYSPAGQVLKRAAAFMRQQVQRSATERDKFGRKLAYKAAVNDPASLETLPPANETVAPVPPYYRSPVPVRYAEMASETIHIEEEEEEEAPQTAVIRNAPLTITEGDLNPPTPPPTRMPTLRITTSDIQPERPLAPPPRPTPARRTSSNRRRTKEGLRSTRLRVLVQEYPDGPGLYGLQVHVNAHGMRTSVSGTTNRDGRFLCELPVYAQSGLTYDIDIVWPREHGGHNERKTITLHADRTLFEIPFYLRLNG